MACPITFPMNRPSGRVHIAPRMNPHSLSCIVPRSFHGTLLHHPDRGALPPLQRRVWLAPLVSEGCERPPNQHPHDHPAHVPASPPLQPDVVPHMRGHSVTEIARASTRLTTISSTLVLGLLVLHMAQVALTMTHDRPGRATAERAHEAWLRHLRQPPLCRGSHHREMACGGACTRSDACRWQSHPPTASSQMTPPPSFSPPRTGRCSR